MSSHAAMRRIARSIGLISSHLRSTKGSSASLSEVDSASVPRSSASRNARSASSNSSSSARVLQHLRRALARVEPAVHSLERELARAPARRSHPATAFRVFAISTATRALSAPFTLARARACSSVFEVSTPFAMGTPVSSCTSRMPRALSLATTSK